MRALHFPEHHQNSKYSLELPNPEKNQWEFGVN
jgi:hypothetical protein